MILGSFGRRSVVVVVVVEEVWIGETHAALNKTAQQVNMVPVWIVRYLTLDLHLFLAQNYGTARPMEWKVR